MNLKQKFSQIYDKQVEKIYRFIFLKVDSKEAAEDLTSETFLRAWEAFEQRAKENSRKEPILNPRAFIYQIARNAIVDYYRFRAKNESVSAVDEEITDPRPNLENQAIINSDLERAKKAMSYLNDDYQNVLIWRYLDSLAIPEIAGLLGRSEEATRVLISRALKSLREKVGEA